jgi:hypothetical protein
MNPNRDAVSVGYLTRVHRAALPVLVDDMDSAGALADWVGGAAAGSEAEVQKAVVQTAFGDNAARSVPPMGKHSSDDDARESVGASIVNVRHLSRGFKDLALRHIKTSREVVAAHYKQLAEQRSIDADKPEEIDQDAVLRGYVEAVGGNAASQAGLRIREVVLRFHPRRAPGDKPMQGEIRGTRRRRRDLGR